MPDAHRSALRAAVPARLRVLSAGVGAAIVVAAAAVSLALYPTATLLAALVAGILALAVVRPTLGFVLAVCLFCFEGTIKVRLSIEDVPSSLGVGAALLDVALAVTVLGMLSRRGPEPLLALWRDARRSERIAFVLLGAWLALSVVQLSHGAGLTAGIKGLRLSQAYVVLGIAGGVLWWSLPGGRRRVAVLCVGLGVAAAYATLRVAIGPSGSEETYALFGTDAPGTFQSSFRTVGSFSGAFGLASMLAPAMALTFALAPTTRTYMRWVCAVVCGLSLVAVVGSQVRTGLVAAAVGMGLATLLLLAERGLRSRQAARLGIVLVALVVLAGAGIVIGSGASDEVNQRAKGIVSPLSDKSVQIRLDTWERTLRETADEPFGSGIGTVGRAGGRSGVTTTDNSYLKILREQGFLGGALFLGGILLLVGVLVRKLIRIGPEQRPVALAALAALAAYLVLMVAGEYIEQPGKVLAWTLLGVALWELHEPREAEQKLLEEQTP